VQILLGKRILPFALLFFFSILGAKSSSAQGTPAITSQPASQTVTAGQAVTFTVVVANGPCRSFWNINGAGQYGSFASTISYTIANTTSAMNGWKVSVSLYGCGSAGTTLGNSQTAILTVNAGTAAPSITAQPANATVTAGQTATFGVVANGAAPLNYQWLKNGANITGATSASYTTPATTSADSGSVFQALVGNSAGSATSSGATLTVNPATVAPTITAQPSNQTVTVGQTATLAVGAGGTAPLSYQWHKNGAMIGGATSASYTTPATTSADNGSTFQVAVGNSAGSVTSNAATMTVNQATGAPSIAQQPQSQTVQPGQSATFTVVIANGPCRSIWYLNGAGSYGSFASTISYTVPNATLAMNGANVFVNLYGCGTTGATLGNSQTAILTVTSAAVAPTITTQPTNQTAATGQTATFTVATSGTAPLSYQWQKNGAPISGASASTYTTPSTTASDNGATFLVVASNSVGSATSNLASLTVTTDTTPPTVSITSPTSGTTVSGTTTLTASAADNIAVANVQFEVDGNNVGSADTTSPYSFSLNTTTLSNASHDVTAVATDTSGNHATSIAVPITVSNQAGNGAPTYANNGSGCPINTVAGSKTDPVTSYNCPLPNPTGAGNLLVVWVRYMEAANTITTSITDNIGTNAYTLAASCNDTGHGSTITQLYYAQNSSAGVKLLSVHLSNSNAGRVQMAVFEFYNVATTSALDSAQCQIGSGTAISSGALPTLTSGDLVTQFGHADNSVAITSCSVGSQSNITWHMRASLIGSNEPMCAQYGIYGAATAFSPSMTFGTSVNYMSVAAAFKAAAGGTPPPSGIRVAYVQHDDGGDIMNSSFAPEFPLSGNLAVEVFTSGCGGSAANTCNYGNSITDGTNTWGQVGSTYTSSTGSSTEDVGQIWYAKGVTPGLYRATISMHPQVGGVDGFPISWMLFDIVGASADPLDLGFGGTGNGLATFTNVNSSGPITTFTATPSAQNELILATAGYDFDTFTGVTSPSGAQFISSTYVGESNYSWDDLNGGWAIYYNGLSVAPETWIWTHDTSQGAGAGRGLGLGAAFQPQ
jgi:Bacterial Ig domain/Immunoglobulin I-set domain